MDKNDLSKLKLIDFSFSIREKQQRNHHRRSELKFMAPELLKNRNYGKSVDL